MSELALQVIGLAKRFGGVTATDDLNLDLRRGEVHAVIGPNGAGKTTLVGQLSGLLAPDAGTILLGGRDVTRLGAPARVHMGLARSFQITSVLGEFSCLANVALAVQAHQGHSFRFWRPAHDDHRLIDPARKQLAAFGLEHRADTLARDLAHGEQRYLELAMALSSDPQVVLLDEPLAGMGAEESLGTIEQLRALKGRYSMLLVEHDMDAVFALADRITVLVYGKAIATGTPQEIRDNEEVRGAYLGTD